MSKKSSFTEEAQAEIKQSEGKTEMKKPVIIAITSAVTVILVGVLTYAGYSIYQWGHSDGVKTEQTVNARIQGAVSAKVDSSKQ